MNRLLMSKEHRNVLAGSRLQFWIKLGNVKESFMQWEVYNSRTGAKISASHLARLCWEEPIINTIDLRGIFSLFVFWQAIDSQSLSACRPNPIINIASQDVLVY